MNHWVSLTRRIGTLILLFVVWQHSHWSVALALTLLAAGHEANAVLWGNVANKAGRRDVR